jgi:DNA-binding NtrC family response regulator
MTRTGTTTFKIAVTGPDKDLRTRIARSLRGLGYEISENLSPDEVLGRLDKAAYDVVLVDVDRLEIDQADLLKTCKRTRKETAIVLLGSGVDVEAAFEAARLGAYQCVSKPIVMERLLGVIDMALDGARLRREAGAVRQIVVGYRQADRFVVGKSDLMLKIAEVIEKVSASMASTVLIQGESGTGKELVAKAIHFQGETKDKPFMEINCSSLPANLLESELFGYEKGAFTDAKKTKKGLVELAEGGTLFLDEIGEMPFGLQTKLLRLIETKRFRRIGGVRDIEVSTRIVAATNRDLRRAKEQGRFRDDLYFRLMVIPIYVPALRERKEDIPIMASYFIDYFNQELNRSVRGLSREAQEVMLEYDWPGNVRELRNVIERAILLESTDLILPEHLPGDILGDRTARAQISDSSVTPDMPMSLKEAERKAVAEALNWAGGNKSKAARALGITRQTLRQKLKAYGLANK